MKNTRNQRKTARRLYQLSLVEGRPDVERLHRVVQLLQQQRPRGVEIILKELLRRLQIDAAQHRLLIESATELAETDRRAIAQQLATRFGTGVQAEFKTTPALLGGLRIQAGWDRFDRSISGRLRQALNQLTATQRSASSS